MKGHGKALALTAIAAMSSGCFTGWVATQAVGGARFLDEGVREEAVPLDGVQERLSVSLPLAIEYDVDAAGAQSSAPQNKKARPFALTCSTRQHAQDRVYHSAFRYGSKWKKTTAISFLVEAALGAAFLLLDRNRDLNDPMAANDRTGLLAGGFLALDAIGTAAIFFIPRKEVYTVEDKAVVTPIRDDCPEGLVLEIGGDAYPVDALGAIEEAGEIALDAWMRASDGAPGGGLALTFEGRAMPLRVDARERCAWVRARPADTNAPSSTPDAPSDPYGPRDACSTQGQLSADLPRATTAVITVPTGSLSTATSTQAATDSR